MEAGVPAHARPCPIVASDPCWPPVPQRTLSMASMRPIRSASRGLPIVRSNSSRIAGTSPSRASLTSLRATAFMSASLTASSMADRRRATCAACGLPGPPGLPFAKRPRLSRPSGPFGDGGGVTLRHLSPPTGLSPASPRPFCQCQSHRRVLTPRPLLMLPTSQGSLAGWLVAGPASYRSIGAIPGPQVRLGRSALRLALRVFQNRTILRGFLPLHGGSIPPGSTAQASLCEACFVIS